MSMYLKMADPKVFNDGFVNNPHPEFGCGPFKLADKGWNSTENTFTMVPNEKWWGEKPVLDRVIFRGLEESAKVAAFKNGEVDAVESRSFIAEKAFWESADRSVHCRVNYFKFRWSPGGNRQANLQSQLRTLFQGAMVPHQLRTQCLHSQ